MTEITKDYFNCIIIHNLINNDDEEDDGDFNLFIKV